MREIMNAILYVDRTGVQWRYLPRDFPPWETVYGYFAKWQKEGVFAQLNGLLRELVRRKEGRNAEPSACVIDAQSVKTSTSVPATSQGVDAGKRIVGRKRSIVTDTIGLLLAAGHRGHCPGLRGRHPTARPGYRRPSRHPQGVGPRRLPPALCRTCRHSRHRHGNRRAHPGTRGFTPIPKRWAVERTYGWLMQMSVYVSAAPSPFVCPAASQAASPLASSRLTQASTWLVRATSRPSARGWRHGPTA